MARWTAFGVILVFGFFRINVGAVEPLSNFVAPAFRIDLRSAIRGNAVPQLGTRETPWVAVRTLHFLDNQRLAATLVTPARTPPRLASRARPDAASPFRLRAVLVEAPTGRIVATPEWPSTSRAAGIVAANENGFVTERGGELTLFSLDLAPTKQLALPSPSADRAHVGGRDWAPIPSWSGKRVLFVAGAAWSNRWWVWLDAENLRILESWQEAATGPVAVSDDQVVWEPFSRHFGDPPSTLMVGAPSRGWQPVPSTLDASAPQFVGPELLYFHRYGSIRQRTGLGAFLLHIDSGEVSRVESPRKTWAAGQAATARTGKRFVILVEQTKGSYPALDIGGYYLLKALLVFDPPFRAASYALEVRGSRIKNPDIVALSPDGRHLAVLAYPDPTLEVFDLPSPN